MTHHIRYSIILTTLMLTFINSFGLSQALAQDNQNNAEANTPIVLTEQEGLPESLKARWIKICEKQADSNVSICQTSIKMRNELGNSIISMAINTVNNAKHTLVVEVPTGTLLPPGFFLRVDNNSTEVRGNFLICDPRSCIGEIPISEGFVLEMKKGNDIYLVFRLGNQPRPIAARVPLAGITRTLEGEPIQPEKLREQTQILEAEMKKLAENYKKELEKQN